MGNNFLLLALHDIGVGDLLTETSSLDVHAVT